MRSARYLSLNSRAVESESKNVKPTQSGEPGDGESGESAGESGESGRVSGPGV